MPQRDGARPPVASPSERRQDGEAAGRDSQSQWQVQQQPLPERELEPAEEARIDESGNRGKHRDRPKRDRRGEGSGRAGEQAPSPDPRDRLPGRLRSVRLSPGGSRRECSDQWLLHVMSVALDGSEPRDLHEAGTCYCIGGAPSLTWSPDGTSIAFVGFRSDSFPGGLTVMNPDGTGLRQVTEDGGGPAWQPVP
jgi:hypothetical protein